MIRLTLPTLSVLLHAYMGWRLLPALPGALAVSTAVLLLLSAWLVPQGLGRRGHGSAHRGLTIAGLVAMGWMSSLLVLTLLTAAIGAFEAVLFGLLAHVVDLLGQASVADFWPRHGHTLVLILVVRSEEHTSELQSH